MGYFCFFLLIFGSPLYILDTNSVFYVYSLILFQSVVCLLGLFMLSLGNKDIQNLANFFSISWDSLNLRW